MTLTEFLLARIEDEVRLAHDAASEGTPHRTGWQLWTNKVETTPGGERLGPRGSIEASSARILAECEAKRRIVAVAVALYEWDEMGSSTSAEGRKILALLALPYAAHPDFEEGWRP